MFFIGRIWKSLGEFDWDGLQNVRNALEAGLYVSVRIFPCLKFPKCAPVQDQVEETINRLNDEGVKYGMVFLDIQLLDWPSNWIGQEEENRQIIDAMGQKLDEMGVEWGICTNKRNWNRIVGYWDKWNDKKLWWLFWGNNHGERYSEFEPFGGWTDFYMQQYAGDFQGPCSVALDLDYYESYPPYIETTPDWYLPFVTPLQRFYSENYNTHHYHTEPEPISSFLADTYHMEPSPGRMITVGLYKQQKHEIRRHCPFLVPLYTAINRNTKSQKMTTNVAQLNTLVGKGGWYKLQQVGYCVKGKRCGATKALVELHIKHELSDILYTSDTNEIRIVNNRIDFGGTATSPLCYLWL